MTDFETLQLAQSEGFAAAFIAPEDIPVNPEFRRFCEENRCGKYNANYSCPPDCGSVEELRQKILAEDKVVIFTTHWDIEDYADRDGIETAKKGHNAAALRFMDQLRSHGYEGFAAGYNGCPLCNPCKRILNEPCAFPDKRISCMSAYCIDVATLAKKCGLEFAWNPGELFLFGMAAFHESGRKHE